MPEETKTQEQLDAEAAEKAKNKNPNPGDEGDGSADDDEDLGDFADPKKAMAEIKKLRKESADKRTKSKDLETKLNAMTAQMDKLKKAIGGEEDDLSPEEKISRLQSEKEQVEIEASINHLARVYQVPIEHDDYFRFLLSKKFSELQDGEEVDDEQMNEIVSKVGALSAGQKGNGTGVDSKKPNPGTGTDGVTAADFKKMGTIEKSQLYSKNPTLYDKLRTEAAALK